MVRLFRHYVPTILLLLAIFEFFLFFLAAELAWQLRMWQLGQQSGPISERIWPHLAFSFGLYVVMLALGLYRADCYRSLKISAARLLVAVFLGAIILPVIFFMLPPLALWRSVFLMALGLSIFLVLLTRFLFDRLVGWNRFKRRLMVLGAGARARRILELANQEDAYFHIVAHVRMTDSPPVVHHAIALCDIPDICAFVARHRIEEVVLALEERRGAVPMSALLRLKLDGVRVWEFSSFVERQTGRVDLRATSASWLIFSDGFLAADRWAVMSKRCFDIIVSGSLLLLTAPLLILVALLIKLTSKGPIFYKQERVGQFGQRYDVIKFRSMRSDAESDGKPVWAKASDPRITAVGRFIRLTRIDEIPQILNVFRGDMSFIGPRPERPFFVHELMQSIPFYNERHAVKPGITGWAQINYPYGASLDDARHKLEYDLYYIKNYSPLLDLLILVQTVRVVLFPTGVH